MSIDGETESAKAETNPDDPIEGSKKPKVKLSNKVFPLFYNFTVHNLISFQRSLSFKKPKVDHAPPEVNGKPFKVFPVS